ncbi:MAG: hypothetical protein V7632_1291 [Bradyrhizobium sp.]
MRFAGRCAALGVVCWVSAQPLHAEPIVRNILAPFGHTLFCTRYPRDCDVTPGRSLPHVEPATRWRELSVVQDWVNAAIAPSSIRGRFSRPRAIATTTR